MIKMKNKMKTLHTETQKQVLSNQVLAEYFAKSDTNVQLEKINNGFFVQIPEFVVMEQFINQTDKKESKTPLTLEEKREKLAKLAGSWVGDFPERNQPIANERIELL